ncbi:MAG TPA: class IV adenylate cyclase [Tepidisphaeraceae bacterium]|nr:class IV adenylate cyclase [Tepidisphaeraceae bacterium]
MPTELEAKMQVPDHEPLRRQLQAAGATRLGACMELNTFFDTPDRTLVAQDKGLRIRLTCDFATGDERHVVTYKGPQRAGTLKHREELEFTADDGEQAALLLQRLGYGPTLSFEKRRETWRLDDCLVELDELPQLGCFVEIEGPDEEAVLSVRETLELADRPLVKETYIAMVDELLKTTGSTKLEFAG